MRVPVQPNVASKTIGLHHHDAMQWAINLKIMFAFTGMMMLSDIELAYH